MTRRGIQGFDHATGEVIPAPRFQQIRALTDAERQRERARRQRSATAELREQDAEERRRERRNDFQIEQIEVETEDDEEVGDQQQRQRRGEVTRDVSGECWSRRSPRCVEVRSAPQGWHVLSQYTSPTRTSAQNMDRPLEHRTILPPCLFITEHTSCAIS